MSILNTFHTRSIQFILIGYGLNSDNLHSPNEKFDIANFYKGIETIPYFHKYFES